MGTQERPAVATAGRKIGYARVSREDQNLALQFDALAAAGCQRIFYDEGISGAVLTRPALSEALAFLAPGDSLVTWRLDRLGRSLVHLIAIMGELSERDIGFRSLSEAIDTTTASGKLIFHVMAAIAEFERELISERTRAGMISARARGASLGRPPKLAADQVAYAREQMEMEKDDLCVLAARLGVAPLTLARALKRSRDADRHSRPVD